ncbi:MAG: flavodoxin [Sphaerochaetaceae bacterium]
MNSVAIVFWSDTGNTEKMATLIADGATKNGAEVSLFRAKEFRPSQIDSFDIIAFGCPAMGAEELEEEEFQPMFSSCEGKLSGKKIALFGSFGWGDGEWMRNWEDVCKKDGAVLVSASVICNNEPDAEAEISCKALGEALALQK